MHLGIVLRNFNSAIWLTLHEEQGQLELLIRQRHRPVDVKSPFHVVQQRVRHLDIPLLKLGDGNLLLDELKEELLFLTNSFFRVV